MKKYIPVKNQNLSTMTSSELVAWMDKMNRPRCIEPNESEVAAHRRAGARELIDSLMNRMEKEENGSRPTKISV